MIETTDKYPDERKQRYDNAVAAVATALLQRDYRRLDDIIHQHEDDFGDVQNGKNPVFCALNNFFSRNKHLEEAHRAFAVESVHHFLEHFDQQLEERIGPKKAQQYLEGIGNHISVRDKGYGQGLTIRELIQDFAGYNEEYPLKEYKDIVELMDRLHFCKASDKETDRTFWAERLQLQDKGPTL